MKRKYNSAMHIDKRRHEQGGVSGSLIAIIALIILVLAAGSAAIWAYMNYNAQKTNVDGRINLAIAKAQKDQGDLDAAKFADREKEPNRQFVGPDDYGRLTFNYPKTWSVYVAKDVTQGGNFEAYLNPVAVPPLSSTQQYSLRVLIEQRDYDQVVKSYDSQVKKGDLRSSVTSANGNSGTRLDGNFTKDIRGSAVIYKIRDKTVTIRTDADTFKPDFDNIIQTINFNS
jgi:Flp pilus assembly protein TadG